MLPPLYTLRFSSLGLSDCVCRANLSAYIAPIAEDRIDATFSFLGFLVYGFRFDNGRAAQLGTEAAGRA